MRFRWFFGLLFVLTAPVLAQDFEWVPPTETLFAAPVSVLSVETGQVAVAEPFVMPTPAIVCDTYPIYDNGAYSFQIPICADDFSIIEDYLQAGDWLLTAIRLTPDATSAVVTASHNQTALVLGFTISTKELVHIGEVPYSSFDGPPSNIVWIGDRVGVVGIGPAQSYLSTTYYGFHAQRADSLLPVMSGWADIQDDPIRLEYIQTDHFVRLRTGSVPQQHLNCVLNRFDAQNGMQKFDLGYDCGDVIHSNQGYFVLQFASNPVAESTIVLLEPATGNIRQIYSGEIEAILSVSPDGRYLIVVTDANGQIDRVDEARDDNFGFAYGSQTPEARLAVIDVARQVLVYSTLGIGDFGAEVEWVTPEIAVITPIGWVQSRYQEATGTFIQILPPGMNILSTRSERVTGAYLPLTTRIDAVSSDGRYGLSGSTIIDLASQVVVPIFSGELESILPDAYVSIEFGTDPTTLVVTIVNRASMEQVQYQIRMHFDLLPPITEIQIPGVARLITGTIMQDHIHADTMNQIMLPSGTLVQVLDRITSTDNSEWYFVRLDTGGFGWVPAITNGVNTLIPYDPYAQIRLLATPTPIPIPTISAAAQCVLTTLQGVNLRALPVTGEVLGSRPVDNQTEADAQFTDESGFVWWRLVNAGTDSGLWVRSDLVAETAGCTSLPVAEISP